jgi:hypothetical protein
MLHIRDPSASQRNAPVSGGEPRTMETCAMARWDRNDGISHGVLLPGAQEPGMPYIGRQRPSDQ